MNSMEEYYPVSATQAELLRYQDFPDVQPAHIAYVQTMQSMINLDAFQTSLAAILGRHSVLRSRFSLTSTCDNWLMYDSQSCRFDMDDIQSAMVAPCSSDGVVQSGLTRFVTKPFNLELGPLVRAAIFSESEPRDRILFVVHHAVFDNWSLGIFIREFLHFYKATVAQRVSVLPNVARQFSDFRSTQIEWLKSSDADRQRAYWARRLKRNRSAFWLPPDAVRSNTQFCEPRRTAGIVDAGDFASLRSVSRLKKATPFMYMLTSFAVVLSKWSGRPDVFVWVMHTGRTCADFHGTIGCFMDKWLLRLEVCTNSTFGELLDLVHEACADAAKMRQLPGRAIDDILLAESSEMPASAINFNFIVPAKTRTAEIQPMEPSVRHVAMLPFLDLLDPRLGLGLELTCFASPDNIRWTTQYNPGLFDVSTIEAVSKGLMRTCVKAAKDMSACVRDLPSI